METIKSKKLRLQSKNFFLTYPQCDLIKEDAFSLLQAKHQDIQYCAIAQEHHQDGTVHLHVLLCLKKKFRTTKLDHFDIATFHGNYQTARSTNDVKEYIFKEDIAPFEYGTYESNGKSEAARRALDNKVILDTPLCDLVKNGTVSIYNYALLTKAKQQYNNDILVIPPFSTRSCYWIYGKPRIGKTYWVRSRGKNIYVKQQNKWWDGYNNEEEIIIDDFDSEQLGHLMKIWLDNYSFIGETKGGTVRPTYHTVWITSNYLPHDIFKDNTLAEAVAARCTMATISDTHELVGLTGLPINITGQPHGPQTMDHDQMVLDP